MDCEPWLRPKAHLWRTYLKISQEDSVHLKGVSSGSCSLRLRSGGLLLRFLGKTQLA
jgi:hypothetical protein